MMFFNTIAKKIGVGFLAVLTVLLVSGGAAIWSISQVGEVSHRIREIHLPAVNNSLRILSAINEYQSISKSWLLLNAPEALNQRRAIVRDELDPSLRELKLLNTDHHSFNEFNSVEAKIRNYILRHESLERIALGNRKQAINLMEEETIPLAAEIRTQLDNLIQSKDQLMDADLTGQASLISRMTLVQGLLFVIGALVSLGIGFSVIRSVTVPIGRATELADAVASGKYDSEVSVYGSDEVNRLGAALLKMRSVLERQTWLNEAQLKFNEEVREVGSLRDLGDSVSRVIAQTIGADTGAFFVVNDMKLQMAGGYSFSENYKPGLAFEIGEGLSGQVLSERRLLSVKSEKPGGLTVQTAQGAIQSGHIVAVPLIYRGEPLGALEFGSINPIQERSLEFLSKVSETTAISLSVVQKSETVRKLLQETQVQTEELQMQEEELRTANEELQSRQEELEATNEELEEQKSELEVQKRYLDEKNDELRTAQEDLAERAEELKQISKYKSEFLANMSHELRTPLNSQLILSEMLYQNKNGNLTEKQIEFAKAIHSTGRDLLQLINDILDLSKVEAGKLSLNIQDIHLKSLLTDLKQSFQYAADQKNLELIAEVEAGLPEIIQTDSLRLSQILRNFLSNAIKFTPTGSIALQVGRVPRREAMISFKVRDTGRGIPKDKINLIFQPFEQVDSSTSREFGGTGLGLAISTQLADLLGGEIQVESEVGVGSVFTVLIPLKYQEKGQAKDYRQSATHVPARTVAVGAKGKSRTLLVVDDEKLQRDQIENLVGKEQIKVVTVSNANEAYETLKQGKHFDCMILDLKLPDVSGAELLTRMSEDPSIVKIPVIVHTAKDLSSEEELQLRRYSESIVIKGTRSNERLLDEVKMVLDREDNPQKRAALVASSELHPPEKVFQGKNVLLVDDDIRNVFAMSNALEEMGMNVIIARNGKEALDQLASDKKIDLVLMDIMMPVMDGYEAMSRIRRETKYGKIPIIALTAKAMKGDREACMAAGASDYLNKPVETQRLITLMRLWLSK